MSRCMTMPIRINRSETDIFVLVKKRPNVIKEIPNVKFKPQISTL